MQVNKLFITIVLCLSTSAVFAHDPNALPKPWSGNIHFGYVANSGNSRNTSTHGKVELKYHHNKLWEFSLSAKGQYESGKNGESGRNANLHFNGDYNFTSTQFGFGLLNYQYDKFAPYTHTLLTAAGYGITLLQSDKFTVRVKAGPGVRVQKEADNSEYDHDAVLYTEGLFEWRFTPNVKFKQTVSNELGETNTYTQAKSSLITKIIGNLSFEASFLVKHYSNIPDGSSNRYKTDTVTGLALIYEW